MDGRRYHPVVDAAAHATRSRWSLLYAGFIEAGSSDSTLDFKLGNGAEGDAGPHPAATGSEINGLRDSEDTGRHEGSRQITPVVGVLVGVLWGSFPMAQW